MKYYIIAGEASGDLHGSNLVKAMKQMDLSAEFRGWGGDLMKQEGVELVKHYRDLAFMGFIEVIANLRTIFKNLKFCKADIINSKLDALILIDYPGFNLRIAEFAHELGIKVIYYISPQIWAWKQSRVHKIKKVVDKMLVILPFEKDFYKRFGVEVDFVGHPLLDAIKNGIAIPENWRKINGLSEKPIIALLPGSRKQEISTMLPVMLQAAESFTDYQFVIAAAPSQDPAFYEEITKGFNINIVTGQTYSLLSQSKAALVTSGTATLETALFNIPEIVCYKGSYVSYVIAKQLIKVEYISLVNLVMEKEVVKELIQDQFSVEIVKEELKKLLLPENKKVILEGYQELKQRLGGSGASEKAAVIITDYVSVKS